MGNLNFQDDQDENQEKNQNANQNEDQNQDEHQDAFHDLTGPDPFGPNEPRVDDDEYIEDPTAGSSKILWIAIIVVLIAGIGGALFMLHRSGYLKFPGKKRPVVTTTTRVTTPPPSAPVQSAKPAKQQRPTPAPVRHPARRTTVARGGSFALQVSAFRTRAKADEFIASLRRKGVEGRVIVSSGAGGGRWFRVITGSYGTRLKAIAQVHSMKKRVGTDVWVVPAR